MNPTDLTDSAGVRGVWKELERSRLSAGSWAGSITDEALLPGIVRSRRRSFSLRRPLSTPVFLCHLAHLAAPDEPLPEPFTTNAALGATTNIIHPGSCSYKHDKGTGKSLRHRSPIPLTGQRAPLTK